MNQLVQMKQKGENHNSSQVISIYPIYNKQLKQGKWPREEGEDGVAGSRTSS